MQLGEVSETNRLNALGMLPGSDDSDKENKIVPSKEVSTEQACSSSTETIELSQKRAYESSDDDSTLGHLLRLSSQKTLWHKTK